MRSRAVCPCVGCVCVKMVSLNQKSARKAQTGALATSASACLGLACLPNRCAAALDTCTCVEFTYHDTCLPAPTESTPCAVGRGVGGAVFSLYIFGSQRFCMLDVWHPALVGTPPAFSFRNPFSPFGLLDAFGSIAFAKQPTSTRQSAPRRVEHAGCRWSSPSFAETTRSCAALWCLGTCALGLSCALR
jgi:hypothetical protein